jgi:hypothetical protein
MKRLQLGGGAFRGGGDFSEKKVAVREKGGFREEELFGARAGAGVGGGSEQEEEQELKRSFK